MSTHEPNPGHEAAVEAPEPARARRVVLFGTNPASLINFRGSLIREMVRRGHEVFALAGHMDADIEAKLRAMGAKPISIRIERTNLNPFEGLYVARELRRLLRRIGPDVMIAYTIKPILLGAAAARAAGVPSFVPLVTGLGYAFTGGREAKRLLSRAIATVLYKRSFLNSRVVIFQNKDDLADFRGLRILPGSVDTAVINGSGVDVDHFAQAPLAADLSFLMIARLVKDKGIREFADAAKRFKQEHPHVRISLVGSIDTEPHAITPAELQAMIASGIDYLGPLADVRPAIAAHAVYVLPSYREGTPRSVQEALAMGRPVITTDAPGCRETVVHGENGLLVPPRDAGALLEAMRRFVREPQLIPPMGEASRRLAEAKYDVRKVNRALLQLAGL